MNDQLKTAVLFLVFNRLDTTKQVFETIRQAKPPRLYVAADGPRASRPDDVEKVRNVRDYIMGNIDWKCDVKTLFRSENLGCKMAVSSAITWFFEHEEMGIILEDDCLPDQSFYSFCEKMLEAYKNENTIGMIAGMNYLFNRVKMSESYFFSRYYPIWGWATWRRAWKLYNINISKWQSPEMEKQLKTIYKDGNVVRFFKQMFENVASAKIDTWDIQWVYTCIFHNLQCIAPKYNLVSNIGFVGTHTSTKRSKFFNMPVKSIDINNIHYPKNIVSSNKIDRIMFNSIIGPFWYPKQLIKTLYRYLVKVPLLCNICKRIKKYFIA